MRHRKNFNHLSRKAPHRKAMLMNMANSLIKHKRISTTVAKAKALRMFVEPLLTKSKDDSTHSRRVVFSYLQDKEAVSELYREISVKIAERNGGYTRILKTGNRLGDNAEMCIIELVDYNENMLAEKDAAPKKATRRRKKSKKTDDTATSVETAKTEVVEEETKETAETEEVKVEGTEESKVEEKKEEDKEKPKEESN